MNLAKLLATYRVRLDDRAESAQLYSDEDLVDNLNEAEAEAAERAWLLYDTTSPLCTIPTVVGQREYPIDPVVFEVRTATIVGQKKPLDRNGYDAVLQTIRDPGIALDYGVDLFGSQLQLVLDRSPLVAGEIQLGVYRRPLLPMALADADTVSPEIPASHHTNMLHWALYLAYSTRDSDAGDAAKAQTAFDKFEQFFGPKIDANTRRQQLRHRPPVCRPNYC